MSIADFQEERNRNIVLVLNEVHIKEGLVYDKQASSVLQILVRSMTIF